MMRILVCLLPLLVLLLACISPDVDDASCRAVENCKAVAPSQQINCRVLEFSFFNARPDVKKYIMIGPFRLLGTVEEYTYSQLFSPFCSSIYNFSPLYADGFIDTSVAMYSDKRGFFVEHPPCWRLRVVTSSVTNVENLILEINYSYCYDDDRGSGYVKAMQRLPLQTMTATTCGVGRNLCETILYSSDESVPFSIVCVCYTLSKRNFYPL